MIGFLASSKAGHDKDKVYVIIKENAEYVWLADGKLRTVAQPKKKRKKHVQLIKYFRDDAMINTLTEGNVITDHEIMMFLKKYNQYQMNE